MKRGTRRQVVLCGVALILGLCSVTIAGPSVLSVTNAPQSTGQDTNCVIITGLLVDKEQSPVSNKVVFLFACDKQGRVFTSWVEGRVANPSGTSDTKGRFEIVAKVESMKKYQDFTVGTFNWNTLSPETLRRGGIPNTLGIDASNYGKKIDLGTITIE